MNLWLNFGMAWLAITLAFILSVIYILRVTGKWLPRGNSLTKLNKAFRKHHKIIGIILIAVGLVHGLFSPAAVWSINVGTCAWIVTILLGVSWMVRKHLKKRKWWMYAHRALTVLFIGLIVWHVVDVGGVQAFSLLFPSENTAYAQNAAESEAPIDVTNIVTGNAGSPNATASSTPGTKPSATSSTGTLLMGGKYKDGTYTGTATGFQPGLSVSVTIKSNKITAVKITSSNDTPRYLNRAAGTVTKEITASQTTNVDTVSGATYSSMGIIDAVNNALAKAKIK